MLPAGARKPSRVSWPPADGSVDGPLSDPLTLVAVTAAIVLVTILAGLVPRCAPPVSNRPSSWQRVA